MSFAQRIEAGAVSLAIGLLRRLSPLAASNLGGSVARTIGPLLPVSRVADANLRLALPELRAPERRRIMRAAWDNLGRTACELPHLSRLSRSERGPGWEVTGAEVLEDQARRGGPAIFFSGHIGNWEMLPPAVASFGIRMSSMYRAAANKQVDAIIGALRREAMGGDLPMFPKGATGARGALAHLMKGGFLGMLVDQKMNDGIEAEFFGQPAMTAPALAALALRFRCPVIPGYIDRLGPARLRLNVEPPLPLPASGDRQADIAALTRQVNATLERWIRARPEIWLWLHRRWPAEIARYG
jgi:KDO2-lipid IV(A) lauroyltransferase